MTRPSRSRCFQLAAGVVTTGSTGLFERSRGRRHRVASPRKPGAKQLGDVILKDSFVDAVWLPRQILGPHG